MDSFQDYYQYQSQDTEGNAGERAETLWLVLWINAIMFVIELSYGLLANSMSLVADSLDMLSDCLVYGVTIFVLNRSKHWKSAVALLKSLLMSVLGLSLVAMAILRFLNDTIPSPEVMGVVGLLALAANGVCSLVLLRFRSDSLNLRTAWLCSRNDMISNLGVLLAAAAVSISGNVYPDLIIALGISLIILSSSLPILVESVRALRS